MTKISPENKHHVRNISQKICKYIDENEEFIVENDFSELYETTQMPKSATDENAWTPDPEIATYALIVVIFIRDVFLKALLDETAKATAENLIKWVRNLINSPDEKTKLRQNLLVLIAESKYSDEEKKRLVEAVEKAM